MTQPLFLNYCKWSSTTSGTGAFTVGAAAAADDAGSHDTPANCLAADGGVYRYYAQSPSGAQTELGRGTYNAASHTLTRTEIIANTDGTTSPVNFSANPIVDLFPTPQQTVQSPTFLPSGTRMTFQQSSVPPGWVKDTNYQDYAPRIVTGTVTSGGVNAFSSTFQYRTSDGTSLSVAQLATHSHPPGGSLVNYHGDFNNPSFGGRDSSLTGDKNADVAGSTGNQGSGAAHTHTYDMRLLFVDFIIGQKS